MAIKEQNEEGRRRRKRRRSKRGKKRRRKEEEKEEKKEEEEEEGKGEGEISRGRLQCLDYIHYFLSLMLNARICEPNFLLCHG